MALQNKWKNRSNLWDQIFLGSKNYLGCLVGVDYCYNQATLGKLI